MQLPVTLALKPSRILAAALVLAHAGAVVGIAAIPPAVAIPFALLIALSLGFSLRRHVLRPRLSALTLGRDGALEVEYGDGRRTSAEIRPQTTVLPWLVTLLLRVEGRTVALALPPDAVGREGHRQLRLWLRWKASAAA